MFASFLQKYAVKSPTLLRAVSWALYFGMKMNTCPNCKSHFGIGQHLKHTWWSPMQCNKCGKKWNYSKKEFYYAFSPFAIVVILGILTAFGGISVLSKVVYYYLSMALLMLLILSAVYSFLLFKRVNLVEKI